MNLPIIFFCLVVFFLFVETTQWCFHVGYRAYIKHRDRTVLSCKTINFRMLYIACFMSFILSTAIAVWLVYIISINSHHIIHCLSIGSLIYLSHIHLLAILGRCSELNVCEFPPISRIISKNIVSLFINF